MTAVAAESPAPLAGGNGALETDEQHTSQVVTKGASVNAEPFEDYEHRQERMNREFQRECEQRSTSRIKKTDNGESRFSYRQQPQIIPGQGEHGQLAFEKSFTLKSGKVVGHLTTPVPPPAHYFDESAEMTAAQLVIEEAKSRLAKLFRWALNDGPGGREYMAAILVVIGAENRTQDEVIKAYGFSRSTFYRRLDEARALYAEVCE